MTRRLRWATPIAIAAGVAAFVGFRLDYLAGREQSATDSGAASSARGDVETQARRDAPLAAPSGPQLLTSGTDYTLSSLATGPIRAASKSSDTAMAGSADDPSLGRLRSGQALQDCLDAIATAHGLGAISAETVDFARFNGAPAIIVRFAAADGLWAWASGPSCGDAGGGAATLASQPVR